MSIRFYKFVTFLLLPIILAFFFFRILFGKEDNKRFLEKLGFFSINNPSKKKLIWFHACSVGEVKSIYGLIRKFIANDYLVLVTTNTYLSALDIKKNFSNTIIHQYLPLDFSYLNKKFLDYWKPNIAVIVESELWPNLIYNIKLKKIPLCWIQARISDKSFEKWLLVKKFFKSILNSFEFIISQSDIEKNKMENIGIKIKDVKNLKFSSSKPNYNKYESIKIKRKLKKKDVITAISSHEGEEEIILKAFCNLLKKNNNLILILQPRHPIRANKVLNKIKNFKLSFKQRSLKELPKKDTQVFLFDTFGESGLIISISDTIILGGTFAPVGGHNIIEPAQFKKSIICGPYYDKISDTLLNFKENNAVVLADEKTLAYKINIILTDKKKKNSLEKNAYKLTLNYKSSTYAVFKQIVQLTN